MAGNILISCEHAGNQVPVRFRSLFSEAVLNSPRSWDPGALDIAVAVSEAIGASCFAHHTTRLLIDINSSLGNEQLFSAYSNPLGDEEKQMILDKYYFPYRLRVENAIAMSAKPVFHFSIHTFTPVLNNGVRTTDVGILFDEQREREQVVAKKMKEILEKKFADKRIDLNEPDKGINDGFTSYLRTRFSDEEYTGIGIGVNQKLINTPAWDSIQEALTKALELFR